MNKRIEVRIDVPEELVKEVLAYHQEFLAGKRDEFDSNQAIQEWIESQVETACEIKNAILFLSDKDPYEAPSS